MTKHAPLPPLDTDDRAIRTWAVEEARRVVFQALGQHDADVYLFGSAARGDWNRFSDIDIAVALHDASARRVVGDIREALEESRIPYFADVIDLTTADDPLRAEVLTKGVRWTRP